MPLKIRTGPLASPATLPAVVSTVDPGLARACACARRAASATRPTAPPAKKDRRSMHSSPREDRCVIACPPDRRSVLRCRSRRYRSRGGYRRYARLQHTAIFFLDGFDPSGSRASVAHRPPGHGDLVAGFEIALLDTVAEQGARPFGFEAPVGRSLVVIRHRNPQPGVRIGVLEFLHHPLQRDGLLRVEHGAGAMSACRHAQTRQNAGRSGDLHDRLPGHLASSLSRLAARAANYSSALFFIMGPAPGPGRTCSVAPSLVWMTSLLAFSSHTQLRMRMPGVVTLE